jgi:hypothetical protein
LWRSISMRHSELRLSYVWSLARTWREDNFPAERYG